MSACRRFPLLLVLSFSLAACRDEKVEAYRVPKEKDPELPAATDAAGGPMAPAAGATMAGTAVDTASGPGLVWTAPPEWRSEPPSAMQKGKYAVPAPGGANAELTVTAFPGDVGGELANVNRWRGQAGLAPLAQGDLAAAVARSSHDGLDFGVVDITGGSQRILAAMVAASGSTWFFKLTGPEAAVAAEKPAFLAFLQTVHASAQP